MTPKTLLASLSLCAAAAASAQHAGVSGCPGSASLLADPGITPRSITLPLKPGSSVPTLGTTLSESPELAGPRLLTENRPFDFMTPSGRVLGNIISRVINADNCSCDLYWQISVSPKSTGRITQLTLRGYQYQAEKPLYADYRADMGGSIAPDQVARSAGAGSLIRFRFNKGLGAGETSRQMFLNTPVGNVVSSGNMQLLGLGGGSSPWLPTQMPSPP